MSRRACLLLTLSLVISFATPQVSFAKEGAACKQLGATKKSAGQTLTCTKAGKKKIWRAAQTKPIAPPSPRPSPSPTDIEIVFADKARAGAACQYKDETAQTKSGPLICDGTWKVVSKESDSVESRAFRIVLDEYLSRPEGELSLIWRIDPATPEWKDQIKEGMIAGARLWGTSPKGSDSRYVYVSPNGNWINEKAKEDGLLRQDRNTEFYGECSAGIVGRDFDRQSYWFYRFSAPSCINHIGFYQVAAHEYTHFAQEALSKRQWQRVKQVPWLDEGLAAFIGGALGPYGANRNDLRNLWMTEAGTVARDLKFFSVSDLSMYRDSHWGNIYPLGALAVEGMVALIGLEGVRKIYTELATPGTTYEEAFRRSTGVGVSAWTELLQGYFDSLRQRNPWSLTKLQSEYAAKR